ncbi:hypothetical protein HS7_20910 [Sulfolobales archaeon HS-7]|nr:hypothetical protein HS7_20910 [Sulfolobales archaeon HS-7]
MELVLTDPEEIQKVAEALSSITRVNILTLVNEKPLGITEISETVAMTKGNISAQVAMLESAGLVEVIYYNGKKGIKKLVRTKYNRIVIELGNNSSQEINE